MFYIFIGYINKIQIHYISSCNIFVLCHQFKKYQGTLLDGNSSHQNKSINSECVTKNVKCVMLSSSVSLDDKCLSPVIIIFLQFPCFSSIQGQDETINSLKNQRRITFSSAYFFSWELVALLIMILVYKKASNLIIQLTLSMVFRRNILLAGEKKILILTFVFLSF